MSISHLNEVLSNPETLASLKMRFAKKVRVGGEGECWPWVAKAVASYGYGRMTAGRGRYLRAHQIAWALENGPIPEGSVVRHSCDNPWCCNPAHLSIGSIADNCSDATTRNRASAPPRMPGAKHPRAKLTEASVQEIRSSAETLDALARRFGVSVKSVWRIRKGLQWKA